MQNSDELTPYRIRAIWAKRKFNAQGYVKFWEIHVKKLQDPFANKMLTVAQKTLKMISEEFDKADANFSHYKHLQEEERLSRSEYE